MLLNSWKNNIPELFSPGHVVNCNILKRISDLEVSQVLGVLVEDKSVVSAVVAGLKGSIDLMEDVIRHIVEVVVTSSMNHSELSRNQLPIKLKLTH